MVLLSQNLESTEQFPAYLLCLNEDGPTALTIEMLAGDIISWLNETACDHEEQDHKLLKYKHEFQRIVAKVSGGQWCHVVTPFPHFIQLIS
jgi:hypothetical protein